MKHSLLPTLILTLAAGGFTSCSTVNSTMAKMSKPMKSLAKFNTNDLRRFKLRDLKNDAPPIVVVDRKKLTKMKTADEKILAWNRLKDSQKRKYGEVNSNGEIFMPQDFDPSDLPVGGQLPSFGLLPSLKGGGSTTAEIGANEGLLPPDIANLPDNPQIPGPVPPLPDEKKAAE